MAKMVHFSHLGEERYGSLNKDMLQYKYNIKMGIMRYNDTVKNFITNHRISVLSIVTDEGVPHASTLHYAWDENTDSFIFFTRTDTIKYKTLGKRASPASLVIGFSEEEFVTLQCHGEAKLIEDESSLEKVYFAIHPNMREYEKDDASVFLKFSPDWYRYTDYKTEEPIIFES